MRLIDWSTLPLPRATELIRERLLPRWRKKLHGFLGVAGVELGLKRVRGRIQRERVPCLKFFVYRKGDFDWSPTLPRAVELRLSASRRTLVPTDVEPVLPVLLQARTPAARLRADDVGSTGFRVGRAGVEYLVSAAHVLQNELSHSEARWEKESVEGRGLVDDGSCWRPRRDPDTGTLGVLDAGLLRIQEPGILIDPLRHPSGRPALGWNEVLPGTRVAVCGQHGVARAEVDSFVDTGSVVVNSRPYWRSVRYRFVSGATDGGDSGAPVLSSSGALLGLHYAVQPHPRTGERCGLAFCAGDILEHLGVTLV